MRNTDTLARTQTLRYSIEYLDAAVREYSELLEVLLEDPEVSIDSLLAEKRAENSLSTGIRFLEKFRKGR